MLLRRCAAFALGGSCRSRFCFGGSCRGRCRVCPPIAWGHARRRLSRLGRPAVGYVLFSTIRWRVVVPIDSPNHVRSRAEQCRFGTPARILELRAAASMMCADCVMFGLEQVFPWVAVAQPAVAAVLAAEQCNSPVHVVAVPAGGRCDRIYRQLIAGMPSSITARRQRSALLQLPLWSRCSLGATARHCIIYISIFPCMPLQRCDFR